MNTNLHPTPQFRDVVREQIRAVGLSLRREAFVVALVLAIVTIIIGIDITRGSAATWFDSDEWFPIALFAFLSPFVIWRGEVPFGSSLFWTFPVDRSRLALAKVLAGGVWLLAALALFLAWQLTLAAFSGVAGAETVNPFVITGV